MTAADRPTLARLREIAAGATHRTRWFCGRNKHPNTDGTPWGVVEWERHPAGGAGKRIYAWSGVEAEADAKHIATFDPPTVTALLDEVEALRGVVAAVEKLCQRAEQETAMSLSTDFEGNRWQSPILLADLRAVLDGAPTEEQA